MTSGRLIRLYRVVWGLGALVLLDALVAGIPWALWHFVGWPLPHHLPTAAQVGRALDHQGIPAQALVDALAVVVWLTWAALMASLAAEIPATLSGRRARRLPLAGIFQPLTGRLVAAVAVACLALAPRPGHLDTAGPSGGHLASVTMRRPVAALVLDEATLTGTTRPSTATTTSAAPPAPAAPPSTAPVASSQPTAPPRTYVVQRGDTLWGIAERELGDPLDWQAIYQLNEGRPEPGGAALTDPHWIDPGWTLLLPAPTAAPLQPGAQAPGPPSTDATRPRVAAPRAGPSPSTVPPTSRPSPPAAPRHPEPAVGGRRDGTERGAPVRLPSGSAVAGSFAAGVLSAVALGRLRRRHAYRYRPPEPGRDLGPPPLRPTLRHLACATDRGDEDDGAANADHGGAGTAGDRATATGGEDTAPTGFLNDDADGRLHPGHLEVGTQDGHGVVIEVTDLSGVALGGPAADDVARALLASLVVAAGPGAAEILCAAEVAERLLPGVGTGPAIRRAGTALEVARVVEAERIARTRRLDAGGASDATSFRAAHPENPLPALLVLADAPAGDPAGRWAGLCAGADRLGIALVFLGDTPAASGRLLTNAARTVIEADPPRLAGVLVGVELFGVCAEEAAELLGPVLGAEDLDVRRGHPDGVGTGSTVAQPGRDIVPGEPWPEPAASGDAALRPIRVEILGPPRITVSGTVVSTGLRSRAKMLLAWYLCRPEGATAEQAVDALWPDTAPDGVLKQFWRSLGDLRAGLRGPGGDTPEVLEKTGEHYRAKPEEISCDLWDLQAALGNAARARDDESTRQALRRAVDAYRGDLLDGAEDPWVEPVRQDLHRRALDAHLRLAELDEHAGCVDRAIAVLERAVELDRYAEEPYRRLMALHAACGRTDAVVGTWKLLCRRLAELDLDVEPTTERLYHTLSAGASIEASRPVRLSS
ncbi:MAG: BTAD domain-containing putative transcriptional regulator [Actinomycetota bacterium]|nr:BTAD domain-containing putative transcriptional regulator [Actinomycetota bacterium]